LSPPSFEFPVLNVHSLARALGVTENQNSKPKTVSLAGAVGTGKPRLRASFHANTTAMMNMMINRRHNPRTSHFGNPATPQNTSTDAMTARMRIVTAHENMFD
jgi:hypothetical protein